MPNPPASAQTDATLDPADWDAFRALSHRMVDDSIDFLRALRDRPAWVPLPGEVRAALSEEGVPHAAQGEAAVYDEFLARVLPYTNGSRSPRFFGWVQGNGTPYGMMADMLASGMNAHMAGFNDAPRLVEERVIAWLAELMGLPAGSGGLLMSGGTMANYLGLAVARHARAGYDVRLDGTSGGPRLMLYASAEVHSWAQKCLELLGMGSASLRKVPVDDAFRVNVDAMRALIHADRAAGLRPICVIGTAGTVNSGATDDLEALADLAAAEQLWFHVDGAFGALARLSPALAPLARGIERADSLALDLHKWGFLPFEIACVLVRDAEAQRAAFSLTPSYLRDEGRGVIAGGLTFAERGPELTRGFKALKVWMSFKAHGVDAIGAIVEQNVMQARAFAERIAQVPGIELCAPVALNIAVWRWVADGFTEEQHDALNRELLLRIQESGLAVPSGSQVRGRYVIRTCITNHRTRWADLERFADGIAPLAHAIEQEMRAAR
ncbi:MAG: pyridoxal-dependent decarboxylase [Gemmatimonadota bacterium]|nr:pyridoxal-dependent decarboxylase [Gemmatimonadota bacterium]